MDDNGDNNTIDYNRLQFDSHPRASIGIVPPVMIPQSLINTSIRKEDLSTGGERDVKRLILISPAEVIRSKSQVVHYYKERNFDLGVKKALYAR